MTHVTVEERIKEFKEKAASWNQLQRAIAEQRVWIDLPVAQRKIPGKSRQDILAEVLGGKANQIEQRNRVLNGQEKSELLWNEINAGMPLHTAVNLLKQVRQLVVSEKLSPLDAQTKVIAEYKKNPQVISPTGKVFHRSNPHTIHAKTPQAPKPTPRNPDSERALWTAARDAIHALALAKLADVPEGVEKMKLLNQMEGDVKSLFVSWSVKIDYTKRRQKQGVAILTRPKIIEACHRLHVDPPPVGKPADLKAASRQKKLLAREYHPDRHGGDEKMRPTYEAVINAYETLEQYNEQFPQP